MKSDSSTSSIAASTTLSPPDNARRIRSVPDLISSIETYLRVINEHPKPLVWTATDGSILTKVQRGRVALQQVDSQI